MKRRLVSMACLLILLPVLPLAMLTGLCRVLAWLAKQPCDVALEMCAALERHFRVDPASEFDEWRKRMRAEREARP